MSMSLRAAVAIASLATLTIGGCGSTSTNLVEPTPVKCTVAVSPGTASFGAAGGAGTVTVTAQPECEWSAAPDVGWISGLSPASAQGTGQVQFQAAANGGPERVGTFTIGDQKVTVTQTNGCAFSVQPSSLSVAASGGTATVAVTSEAGCIWSAASQTPWILLSGSASKSGPSTAAFMVTSNIGIQRSGQVIVADRSVTVTQDSGCTFTIDPTSQSFGVFGGNGGVSVTPSAIGCSWTATSGESWITIRSGESGTDAGTVVYTVGPSFTRRTGTLTIGGRTFTVLQN